MKYTLILLIPLFISSCKTVYYNAPITWCDNNIERTDTLIQFDNHKAIIKTKEGWKMHVSPLQIIN